MIRRAPVLPLEEKDFQRLKVEIHEQLVESLELASLAAAPPDQLGPEIREAATQLCRQRLAKLDAADHDRMLRDLLDEVFGLGPLEPLMADVSVCDILVNGPDEVFVEREGRLEKTDVVFAHPDHVRRVIQRAAARVGRRIDEVTPMVDARLPDGSRLNAIVPPLALKGPTMSIRRFGASPLQLSDLLAKGSMCEPMAAFLQAAVQARVSFLISGGTGTGKTTLLNALSASIPPSERLVTIEDSAELRLQHPHVIPLETRVENTEGAGAVTQRDLLRNSLRMRPDRILVGEVRGPEALDMLQAMNTGHEGSLTTIHANDTRDALSRLEMMAAMTGFDLPTPVMRQYIAAGIKLVVHLARLCGGVRRVTRVSELVEVVDGQYRLEDVFAFEQSGLDAEGRAEGRFVAAGWKPRCLQRMRNAGCRLPSELFNKSKP